MLVLFEHRRLIDVIIGRQPMVACVLGKEPDVLQIIPANVHIEEDHVAVHILLPRQVLEVATHRRQRFGKARLLLPGIQREIEDRRAGIRKPVGDLRT
jgi:hypothetical protein